MTTLPNKKGYQNDRISDLPSNIIDSILANLEITNQVRTSILSKKWRYVWTSAPHLCFENYFFECFRHVDFDDDNVISKTITNVLMGHNGSIHRFTLSIYDDSRFKMTWEHLNMWIPILLRRGIKYLDLPRFYEKVDQMPFIVLSCKELTYFKFGGFHLSIPTDFWGFKKLLELHLDNVTFKAGALESLMSGSPFLEKLNIEYCDGFEYLDISSPSLKVLLLLQLSEDVKSICLKKEKNLIDFTLDANYNKLSDLIKNLPKIKTFTLFRWTKNPNTDIIPPTLLASSFSSLEHLKLSNVNLNEGRELLHIVNVLKNVPSLVKLDIQSYDNDDTTQVLDPLKELESCCCLKLQTVNIYVDDSTQYGMSLIKFLLANSPLLKTLTFNYISEELDANYVQNFTRLVIDGKSITKSTS